MIRSLLQLCYPREFRIARPAWSQDVAARLAKTIEAAGNAAADAARAIEASNHAREKAVEEPVVTPKVDLEAALLSRLRFLADAGTGIWRMRRNMVSREGVRLMDARPLEEMRKPFRWLISTWDSLAENGLEIFDHTGDRYISGQALKAVFEAAPDLHEDTITDTIKPTIYFGGKLIQMGEVVVGTPDLTESE